LGLLVGHATSIDKRVIRHEWTWSQKLGRWANSARICFFRRTQSSEHVKVNQITG
jgi:hypothetical protein